MAARAVTCVIRRWRSFCDAQLMLAHEGDHAISRLAPGLAAGFQVADKRRIAQGQLTEARLRHVVSVAEAAHSADEVIEWGMRAHAR